MLSRVLNPGESAPARNRHSRRRRRASLLSKGTRQILPGFVAFFIATYLLGQLIPSPAIPSNIVFIGPKYDYYQAHKDEYNTLFFGSSRIYSQVIPEVFDKTAKEKGLALNSYNFGIPAMRAIDSTVLLETVLANPPKNLKWVFFESILDKGYEPIPNARTHRAMYWHDWESTGFAARYILSSDESLPNKAVLLSSHFLPFLYHHLNVGRLFRQMLPSSFSLEEQAVAAEFTATEGFYALSDETAPERQQFLNDQQAYLDSVAVLGSRTADTPWSPTVLENSKDSKAYLSTNKAMLLNRITEAVRAAGAEPVFIDPPSLHLENDFPAAQKLGKIDRLLTYRDPNRFPQLYTLQNRYDADHLNRAGSEEFTRLIAQDFNHTIASTAQDKALKIP